MTVTTDRTVGTRIVKLLRDVQRDKGMVSTADIHNIARLCSQPLYKIQEIVSFFPHFRRDPAPRCQVHLCRDMACRLRGSGAIAQQIRQALSDSLDKQVEVHEVSCLGRCDRAPAAMIDEKLFLGRSGLDLIEAVDLLRRGESPPEDTDRARIAATFACAEIDPYAGQPSYQLIRDYVRKPSPENVLKAIEIAGLLGMGGAGGRTFLKWKDVLEAKGESKYVVCNGDESEPGTFKDRELLLATPHLIVEGMVLAGLVVGARQGFVYIRHEYHEQIEAMEAAIEQAVSKRACGANIFGSGRSFELEVFTSPGGYICGEQTALIEAIEGKRAEPRNRPPELQTNGLYDQPTLLNNVETFAWVPAILLREPTEEMLRREQLEASRQAAQSSAAGRPAAPEKEVPKLGLWYKHSGIGARGRRFFSISGDVNRPGAYEVPCGITLGELIDKYCGGIRRSEPLQAVALSGPSGGFLPAKLPAGFLKADGLARYPQLAGDQVDVRLLPLDINASRTLGFMLGGGIVIYGESADMLDQALACSRFYQQESCGKCVPCRIGSQKIVDFVEAMASAGAKSLDGDSSVDSSRLPKVVGAMIPAVEALGRTMESTSICGLGQVASNPLRSYLKFFYRKSSDARK